ncbi:unnamed protein product [Trichogramma brassicae]|uniref:Uncharacterized protein n=1 Tax=Trichogramma brassicae TaxID=86971 RepID=A0A6H5J6Q2_9HYME|nr:unnamed protein product [Trichogramma brassicae]
MKKCNNAKALGQAELNEDGKPSLRRTTAVHRVEDTENSEVILFHLFEIYNRFDVNYTDESGYTHFHAACKSRNYHAIEKFLELGQDPNCIVPETGDSPLHLIIAKDHGFDRAIQLLIRSGADPTLPNKEGLTPLHVICKLIYYESVAKTFLEICDDVQLIVQVDARDELGRTPLQLAVANLSPGTVDVLLDRGADLSSFVFPTEDYFGKERKPDDYSRLPNWYFFLVSSAMIVVERLEKRGYELERSGALTIMKFFIKHAFFKNSEDFKKCLNSDKIFACAAKETMFVPGLSFYDFIQLPCEKAEKLLTHENLFKLDITEDFLYERITVHRPCVAQLCEMRTRRFLRRWALEPLLELTRHYRLPIPCCEFQNISDLAYIIAWARETHAQVSTRFGAQTAECRLPRVCISSDSSRAAQ